jgi:hypothetical protein
MIEDLSGKNLLVARILMEESVSAPRKGINLWSVEQESKKSKLRLVGLTDARLIELVIEELTSAEEIPSFISICKLINYEIL